MSSLELDRRLVDTRIRRIHDSLNVSHGPAIEHHFRSPSSSGQNPISETSPILNSKDSSLPATVNPKRLNGNQ